MSVLYDLSDYSVKSKRKVGKTPEIECKIWIRWPKKVRENELFKNWQGQEMTALGGLEQKLVRV
jgi:hypothetical protein